MHISIGAGKCSACSILYECSQSVCVFTSCFLNACFVDWRHDLRWGLHGSLVKCPISSE